MQVLIVDDHPLYRDALRSSILLAFPDANIAEAETVLSACDTLDRRSGIDLILLDLSMQGVSGFDGLMAIRRRFPKVPVLIVSGMDDPRIIEDALHFGAAGFVPKSVEKAKLIGAVNAVLNGCLAFPETTLPKNASEDRSATLATRISKLTPQQFRVLLMIRQGKLNKQIAHELTVGDSTVKAHVTEILRKLGVASRTQIVIETASLNFDRPN